MPDTITVNYGTADGPVLEIPDGDVAKKWGVHPKAPLTKNQAWALVQDLPETPENQPLLETLIRLAGVLPGPKHGTIPQERMRGGVIKAEG